MVGSGILAKAGQYIRSLSLGTDAVVITNAYIKKLYGKRLAQSLEKSGLSVQIFEVADTEKSKSLSVASALLAKIAKYDTGKKIFVVAFGGGVVGDLAGYVAAIYKRGVSYVQVPTTFLAQIDSAIGGKVAVDLPSGKNLVGAFHQPKLVLSDVFLLKTLSKRQIRNGLAEAVKYGIIRDAALFFYIARCYKRLLKADTSALNRLVVSCSKIKADVVSRDEKETKGIRTILNFGHTVGHAIESASRYEDYQHGEAISLGMRVAADISVCLKMLNVKDAKRIDQLLSLIGLPQRIKNVSLSGILERMRRDKKNKSGKNRFVLAQKIGSVKVVQGIPEEIIRQAILSRMSV